MGSPPTGSGQGLWLPTATRRWLGQPWPGGGEQPRSGGAGVQRIRRRVTVWWCGVSALLPGAQQSEGVLKALVEDRVGELPVGQGAGELQCSCHQGEDAERLGACRRRVVRVQAGGDVVDDGQQAVGVGAPGGFRAAAYLVEQGGGRAAVGGVVAVLRRGRLCRVRTG
jgi:hypothetical protein